ncbi:MAG: hypoxanthine-guanine phosphoribosyltransferase [Burkholderiales bacterium]
MPDAAEARRVLATADLICAADAVEGAIARMAAELTQAIGEAYPLVLAVMGGAVFFTGQLLPRLAFPLDFDYLHVTRYRDRTVGGDIDWRVEPHAALTGRTVLVLDDILDEGHTLAAIRARVLAAGAARFLAAVLCEKDLGRAKPARADFTGVTVPDRYVFGCGMDVRGMWRNLPAIYAVGEER